MPDNFYAFLNTPTLSKRTTRFLAAILILVHVGMVMGFLGKHGCIPNEAKYLRILTQPIKGCIPDEGAYIELSSAIKHTGTYRLPYSSFEQPAFAPNTYYAPGWPILIALSNVVFGEIGFKLLLITTWLLALFAADRFARALQMPPVLRWIYLYLFTFNPLLLFYHGHMMTEPIVIALSMTIMLLGMRIQATGSWKYVVLLAIVSGCSHLLRTQLLTPALIVWGVILLRPESRRYARLFPLFALIHLAIITPWLLRQASVGAGYTIELKAGHILAEEQMVDSLYYPYEPGFRIPEQFGNETPKERDRYLMKIGIDYALKHPLRNIVLCIKHVYYLLSPVPNFYRTSELVAIGMALTTLVFLWSFLFLLGYTLSRRPRLTPGELIVLLNIIAWYAFHIVVHASVRQRLPSDPWVAALALALWFRVCARAAQVPATAPQQLS